MRQNVQQHFGIGTGIHMAQVFVAHALIQLVGIGQVAVVRQHDAERGADIKRLSLSRAARIACRRIAYMADADMAGQLAHIAGAEHFAHHALPFVHMESGTFQRGNTGRILPPVLQHLQTVIQQLVYRFVCHKAENTTH